MAWGVGGWLLTPFLQKIGDAAVQKLKERVARELKTTFASSYSGEVSLAEALKPENIAVYGEAGDRREVPRPTQQGSRLGRSLFLGVDRARLRARRARRPEGRLRAAPA